MKKILSILIASFLIVGLLAGCGGSSTSSAPAGGDSAALADALDATGVAVRGGLHCAPAMHSYLGTLRSGAVRFAPGPFTTERDIDDTAALVARLMR